MGSGVFDEVWPLAKAKGSDWSTRVRSKVKAKQNSEFELCVHFLFFDLDLRDVDHSLDPLRHGDLDDVLDVFHARHLDDALQHRSAVLFSFCQTTIVSTQR